MFDAPASIAKLLKGISEQHKIILKALVKVYSHLSTSNASSQAKTEWEGHISNYKTLSSETQLNALALRAVVENHQILLSGNHKAISLKDLLEAATSGQSKARDLRGKYDDLEFKIQHFSESHQTSWGSRLRKRIKKQCGRAVEGIRQILKRWGDSTQSSKCEIISETTTLSPDLPDSEATSQSSENVCYKDCEFRTILGSIPPQIHDFVEVWHSTAMYYADLALTIRRMGIFTSLIEQKGIDKDKAMLAQLMSALDSFVEKPLSILPNGRSAADER